MFRWTMIVFLTATTALYAALAVSLGVHQHPVPAVACFIAMGVCTVLATLVALDRY